ncbi:MAG: MerR family transcriptional regulator [Sulfuritalea sp.]|nr:MerR family transcriptional regulator [Sulfuritalea sp.]MDP1983389.1 MerR family transcriptional regulator [Sulfuritalea sp.]
MTLEDNEQLPKIGDVAETLAVSIRAIRYYEEEGLITPLRSEGGTRLYSQYHIDRLRAILRLVESGYSLGVIKALAMARAQHRTGDNSQKAVSDQLNEMLAGIDAQVRQLQTLAKQIGTAKSTIKKCAGCKNRPTTKGCPQCPVRQHLSEIELLNLVWDQEG